MRRYVFFFHATLDETVLGTSFFAGSLQVEMKVNYARDTVDRFVTPSAPILTLSSAVSSSKAKPDILAGAKEVLCQSSESCSFRRRIERRSCS